MARRRAPSSSQAHATLYDFRDLDIMYKISENTNGNGITSQDVAELLGFDAEDARPVSIRLAWMRRYGMVAFDEDNRLWKLSRGGARVTEAHLRAPALRVIEQLPDETMIEAMAHVTSRFQRGDTMLAQMMRREFLFGTKGRR
jgi:hypothetical protein